MGSSLIADPVRKQLGWTTLSWVTLHLAPGRYELICNLPGHYAAGMFAELDVR
jgi:hypothetical protein